jgi:hypothetical protein
MHRTPLPLRIVGAFTDLVRWGEPWDVEDDDDPLLDRPGFAEPASVLH